MNVAFVHDWLLTYRGGERVLEALLALYPDAPIYTLFYDPKAMPPTIRDRRVITPSGTSWLKPLRKAILPLLPTLIESLPLEQYDLIISTSSCVAKGVMPAPHARHLCYIHSPMRYVWDQRAHYVSDIPAPLRPLWDFFASGLRTWDAVSAHRVDTFVANSRFVAQRVKRYYGRDSVVVHPPVDPFPEAPQPRPAAFANAPYFLVAGAAVPYKRFDLAVAAAKACGKNLAVAGSGPQWSALERERAPNIHFFKAPDRAAWAGLMQHAEALIFPGIEDFGMTAVEAMHQGTPVIALKGGGALDFIKAGLSGRFFEEPTTQSLADALCAFRREDYPAQPLKDFAMGFSHAVFMDKMRRELEALTKETMP